MDTDKEEYMIDFFSTMIYTAPALLHALVNNCHNPEHVIPGKILKILEERKLFVDGAVPEVVKEFILRKIKLTQEGGISMELA